MEDSKFVEDSKEDSWKLSTEEVLEKCCEINGD
jgi:hypothetical protein